MSSIEWPIAMCTKSRPPSPAYLRAIVDQVWRITFDVTLCKPRLVSLRFTTLYRFFRFESTTAFDGRSDTLLNTGNKYLPPRLRLIISQSWGMIFTLTGVGLTLFLFL